MWINNDIIYDRLSTWKSWNALLTELRLNKWTDIVNYFRQLWKTPKIIAKILKYKSDNKQISTREIFKKHNIKKTV